MSSTEREAGQIITDPAEIDHSRYRVLLGPVRHVAHPIHEIGEVRVVGADSLGTAHSWMQEELARYLEPDYRERADGARAAIVEVDRAAATATLVSSWHGPTAAVLDQVTDLMGGASPASLPDFSRPYRARLYNRLDLITYESVPFRTEAAARLWLQDKGEQAHSDGVQACITRLDPTLGWPRPIFEFAALRPDFGVKLHSSLTRLDNAEDAFLPGVQPGAPLSMLNAYRTTEHALQAQTSASDLFAETVYRDRLAYRLYSTRALDRPAAADPHPVTFALHDRYRVRRDNPAHATWDTAMITAAREEADRVSTPRRVFRFHDRRDASRIIEVLWTGSAVPVHRQGWFATEHQQTPEGTTRFIAMLGRRSTGYEMLNMLTDRMAAFSTTAPVLRPKVDIPREPSQEIAALAALHSSRTDQVHQLTRQSDTLRRPFAVHTIGPASATESGPREGRDYPPGRAFDLWRDGLFPGSRTGAITHNPFVRHNDRTEQALMPAGRTEERSGERTTGADPALPAEPGGRIGGLIEIAHAQQPPELRSTPALDAAPQAMPPDVDREQGPTADHELD